MVIEFNPNFTYIFNLILKHNIYLMIYVDIFPFHYLFAVNTCDIAHFALCLFVQKPKYSKDHYHKGGRSSIKKFNLFPVNYYHQFTALLDSLNKKVRWRIISARSCCWYAGWHILLPKYKVCFKYIGYIWRLGFNNWKKIYADIVKF